MTDPRREYGVFEILNPDTNAAFETQFVTVPAGARKHRIGARGTSIVWSFPNVGETLLVYLGNSTSHIDTAVIQNGVSLGKGESGRDYYFEDVYFDNPTATPVPVFITTAMGGLHFDDASMTAMATALQNGVPVFPMVGHDPFTVQPLKTLSASHSGIIETASSTQVYAAGAAPDIKSILIQVSPVLNDGVTASQPVNVTSAAGQPELILLPGMTTELVDDDRDFFVEPDSGPSRFWVTIKETV